jgi:hypothetical protein
MKKKKRAAPPPAKPGIGDQHLFDIYGELPESFEDFQHDKSETLIAMKRMLPLPDGISLNTNNLSTILNKFARDTDLTREQEFESYVSFCAKQFTDTGSHSEEAMDKSPMPGPSQQEPSTPVKMKVQGLSAPGHGKSVQVTRQVLTPRKLQMKKRLTCLSSRRKKERANYLRTLKSLKRKLDYTDYHDKKVINQCRKWRKNSMLEKDEGVEGGNQEIEKRARYEQ